MLIKFSIITFNLILGYPTPTNFILVTLALSTLIKKRRGKLSRLCWWYEVDDCQHCCCCWKHFDFLLLLTVTFLLKIPNVCFFILPLCNTCYKWNSTHSQALFKSFSSLFIVVKIKIAHIFALWYYFMLIKSATKLKKKTYDFHNKFHFIHK